MYDSELVLSILEQIHGALQTIMMRSIKATDASYFTNSNEGMEKLDSICMLFIAIGESIKNIDKITNKKLFSKFSEIDWKGIMGFRDVIAHHYFDIDAEQVYWICKNELEPLTKVIEILIRELPNS